MFVFQPSDLLDEIYEAMEPYVISSSEYDSKVILFVEGILEEKGIDFTTERIGDYAFGSCAISWIEENKPVLLLFSYVNNN